jgi:hypothetical protein
MAKVNVAMLPLVDLTGTAPERSTERASARRAIVTRAAAPPPRVYGTRRPSRVASAPERSRTCGPHCDRLADAPRSTRQDGLPPDARGNPTWMQFRWLRRSWTSDSVKTKAFASPRGNPCESQPFGAASRFTIQPQVTASVSSAVRTSSSSARPSATPPQKRPLISAVCLSRNLRKS